jgi:hypothetical protein
VDSLERADRFVLRVIKPAEATRLLAQAELDAAGHLATLHSLATAADDYLAGRPTPFPARDSGEDVFAPPRAGFTAEYCAFLTWSAPPPVPLNYMAWVDEWVTGTRPGPVTYRTARYASAALAVERLTELPYPPEADPFRAKPLCAALDEVTARTAQPPHLSREHYPLPDLASCLPWDYRCRRLVFVAATVGGAVTAGLGVAPAYADLRRAAAESPGLRDGARQLRARPLAGALATALRPADLEALAEDLRWEFAAARARLPGAAGRARVATFLASDQASARGRGRQVQSDARGAFAHGLLNPRRGPLKTCLTRFNREAQRRGWDLIDSVQGLRYVAATFAARAGLGPR